MGKSTKDIIAELCDQLEKELGRPEFFDKLEIDAAKSVKGIAHDLKDPNYNKNSKKTRVFLWCRIALLALYQARKLEKEG